MEPTEILLDLAPAEASVLHDGLEALLHEVRMELARTDDRHYRKQVHDRLDRLEAIQAKLDALIKG